MNLRILERALAPIRRRIAGMVSRAVLQSLNSEGGLQLATLSMLAGEQKADIEHFEPYGFTSKAHPGAEAIVLFVGGDRSHGIVISVADRRYRLTGLPDGEAALYDDQGQVVHVKRNGLELHGNNVLVSTAGVLRLDGDRVEIHGRTYLQTDVAGLGERRTHEGVAVWHDDTYTTGATVNSTEHGIDPPALPTEHPEG